MPKKKTSVEGVAIDAISAQDIQQSIVVNTEYGLTAHMIEMARWELSKEAHALMDEGMSVVYITRFYTINGFPTTETEVREYQAIRRRAKLCNMTMERLVASCVKTPVLSDKDVVQLITTPDVDDGILRNELDAVDYVIQKGYTDLRNSQDPVSPQLMLQAIKLKNDLTGGMLGGMTNYGLAELRELEAQKSKLLIDFLFQFVPDDKKPEVVGELMRMEEEFYAGTPYYEMYLRSRDDLNPAQVDEKLSTAAVKYRNGFQTAAVDAARKALPTSAKETMARQPDQKLIQAFVEAYPRETDPVSSNRRTARTAIGRFKRAYKRGLEISDELLSDAETAVKILGEKVSEETIFAIQESKRKKRELDRAKVGALNSGQLKPSC